MGVYSCASENSLKSAITKLINDKDDAHHNPVESMGSEERKVMADELVSPSNSRVLDPSSPKHDAAIKLQKVYKSFRTRRKLADCAVLIEQSWWKLLDFAELKHSSISFFDIDRHETAISRWSRARTRAAKVGKGLSKNAKAQKLALQHWLEAIDPRHRYGHNLHLYYVKWLNSQSKEPFFYWLDIGEGKDINLIEKCPRSKLQQQCIKYLGPMERRTYEVVIEGGKLVYKKTGELLNTTKEYKGSKWIFVLSTSKTLYVGKKNKGTFQHSSFLAGGATVAAGRIVAENGVLKAVWPHSGHYKPTPENFQDFISFLRENSLDLNDVKLDPIGDEEEGLYLRSNASEDDLPQSRSFSRKLTALEIPCKDTLLEKMMRENRRADEFPPGSPTDELDEVVPEECISQRISQHKETKSFQLGKQLSCNWTTGAGPRIGCLRDYPSRLQSHALEEVNLSPRSTLRLRLDSPSRGESRRSSSNLSCRTSLLTTSPIHSLTSC